MKTSVLTPYAAYLRVYTPLAALPGPERKRWQGYVDQGNVLDPVLGAAMEHRQALAGLIATPPVAVPPHESDDAFVLLVDGQPHMCPWQTRLRSWVALEDLRGSVDDDVLDAFLPPLVVDQAEADYARWRSNHPGTRPQILTNTWHVPLRWFVPFAPRDRVLERTSDGSPRRLFYLAPMVEARRRMARALRVLRRSMEEGPVTEGVAGLGKWLEEFHPKSYVELDYGGLVRLQSAEALEEDRSAEDIAGALSALSDGDIVRAGEFYRRLVDRWRDVQAFEHAS